MGAQARGGNAVTRDQRIHAIAVATVRALHHNRWHPARAESEARDNATVRRLAEVAMDAADATREPCPCRQCHLDRLAAGGGL